MIALVTGAGGFLGGEIAKQLRARGDAVRSLTRSNYPWLEQINVVQKFGDLSHLPAVEDAVKGVDVVFHVAAKAGIWGRAKDFHDTNVKGTQNIIAACLKHGVKKLVYTSTPSVVHPGGNVENGDESMTYPIYFEAEYPRSKAKAEKFINDANGSDLATVSLRPHLIWGPGDPHLIPRVIEKAKKGKLRKIGEQRIMVDTTFVSNAADAHILAADRLDIGSPIAGKNYFISDDSPVELWEFVNRILAINNVPLIDKSVSLVKAKWASTFFEMFYSLFFISAEPPLTKFVVSQLSTSHWYNISAAKRDLGYVPQVSIEQGLKKLAAVFSKGSGHSKGS